MTAAHRKLRARWGLPGVVVLATGLLAANIANAQETTFKVGISTDYSTGDYGTGQTVDIWSVPLTAKVENGRWSLELKVPYISINSAGDVVGGTDSPIVTKKKKVVGSNARSTESGLGDIVGSMGYAILTGNDGLPLLEIIGKVKVPTASESDSLGTGEFDYSAQLELAQTFGKVTPFGTLGYRIIGEPSGVDLDNIFFATVGAGYAFNPRVSAGLAVDYSQATTSSATDMVEVSPYVSWDVTKRWGLLFYGLLGVSNGSPDSGGGVKITAEF
jgi:hypothetical protein